MPPHTERRRPMSVEGAQTSMLQRLRRAGHAVDFSLAPQFSPELPGAPSRHLLTPLHAADGKPCPYCGREMRIGSARSPTRDHKIPRCYGHAAAARPGNILVVCRPCNGDKGGRSLTGLVIRLDSIGDPRATRIWALVMAGH